MLIKRNTAFILTSILIIFLSCGGGNRIITNVEGDTESGELVLDSLPSFSRDNSYKLSYGDVLDISFLHNDEYSQRDVKVRPDGMISYPYIGELKVAGISPSKLDSILTSRFSEIVLEPDMTVTVKEFKEQMVYVLGEVELPGGYEVNRARDLLSALSLARGTTKKSKENGVLVIRRRSPNKVIGININYKDLVENNRFDLNIALEPYDIVYVPKSKIGKAVEFVESLYDILNKPAELYIKGWEIWNAGAVYEYYERAVIRAESID